MKRTPGEKCGIISNRTGKQCQVTLNSNGKCFVHDCDLAARNTKVARGFMTDYERFIAQRRSAGKKSFAKLVAKCGGDKNKAIRQVVKKSRDKRLENPTKLEKTAIECFDNSGVAYKREQFIYNPKSFWSCDFVISDYLAVEIDGLENFELANNARAVKLREKKKIAESNGYEFVILRNENEIIDFCGKIKEEHHEL